MAGLLAVEGDVGRLDGSHGGVSQGKNLLLHELFEAESLLAADGKKQADDGPVRVRVLYVGAADLLLGTEQVLGDGALQALDDLGGGGVSPESRLEVQYLR